MANITLLELKNQIADLRDKEHICNRLIDSIFDGTYNDTPVLIGEAENAVINTKGITGGGILLEKKLSNIDLITDKLTNIRSEISKLTHVLNTFEITAIIEI